jgi:hypothetical protein
MLDEVPKADNVFDTVEAHFQIKFQPLNKTLLQTQQAMIHKGGEIQRKVQGEGGKKPLVKPAKPDEENPKAKETSFLDMTKKGRIDFAVAVPSVPVCIHTWGGFSPQQDPDRLHTMWSTYSILQVELSIDWRISIWNSPM